MEISSPRATTKRQIEGGIRGNLVDMNESVNPFEVGSGRFMDFNKNEFTGCNSLQKLHVANFFMK